MGNKHGYGEHETRKNVTTRCNSFCRTRSAVRISDRDRDRDRDVAVAVNRDAITATSFDNVRVPPYIFFFLHFLCMNVVPTR